MQHPIVRRGEKMRKILCKTTSAVVDPNTDSLTREAAANHQIQVVIAIHVDGGDVHTLIIRVEEGKRTRSFSSAQLQLNAVNVTRVALFDLSAECDIGFVIAI